MNALPLTIVTGASRGLGLALAQQRLAEGHRVLALARSAPPLLHPLLEAWAADLADPLPVAARLQTWLLALDTDAVASLDLIHNAGIVAAPGPLAAAGDAELSQALRVTLEAPLVLSAAFLRATGGWTLPRRLLFISSGLGRRGMAGSAGYCAAKAGMDNLARALALEEAQLPHGARVASLAPGVIDTDMQAALRGADPATFSERATFAALHAQGRLDSPAAAAAKVLRLLDRDDFGSNPVTDVRDA